MPEVVFSVDQSQVDARPGRSRAQQVAPGHPRRRPWCGPAASSAWSAGSGPTPDRQQRLGQRRTRRRPDHRSHAQRPDRRGGRRARRPARRRHPRPRPGAAGGRGRARPGLGLHRHLRQGQRRRLPDRLLPGRLQGDLGLPRPGGHLPPPSRGPLHRHHPPRAVRHRAVGRAAGPLEPPRAGADRHRPEPGPAARPAAAGGRTHSPARPPATLATRIARGGRAHRAGPGERRQPRHQELHPRLAGLLPGARRRTPSSPAATCTSARATERSPSAAPSRWAASSTSTST